MKYILVTGGVISGVGKGIIASSIGVILKSHGIRVSAIKIDPYLNIDAGTFSPYEHGEVFVLDDGGEVDLDLGNYERFLGVKLHRDNNITTGKIYSHVIKRERHGDYLGKTVQVVPHITDCIQEWVERVAAIPVDGGSKIPQVCIVELGGTIGDIEGMAFVEAFRQFQFRVKRENFLNVHVSLIIEPKSTGEQKTKPTQANVRELRGLGLIPDLIVCRSEKPLTASTKIKVANFCDVCPEQVISVHDVPSLYHVPLLLSDQGVLNVIHDRLKISLNIEDETKFSSWRQLAERWNTATEFVKIALVGKYVQFEDAYASVTKALSHAALHCSRRLKLQWVNSEELENETKASDPVAYNNAWETVHSSDGVIVPGGFGDRGIEGMIAACSYCRLNKLPFLGVCLGMQCAVIEVARSVLNFSDANSTEFNKESTHPVIINMPEHHPGPMGGTMRLGLKKTLFKKEKSILKRLYGDVDFVEERHRHRYEVNTKYLEQFEANGLEFVGHDVDNERMEICELKGHPYFVGVQFHPEYISQPIKPSPPYLGLVLASIGELESWNHAAPVVTNGHHISAESGGCRNGLVKNHLVMNGTTAKETIDLYPVHVNGEMSR